MRYLWILLLILVACSEKSEADKAGDPLPNAKAGMEALYSGDIPNIDKYICKEIILSLRAQVADDAAEQGGRIDLSQAKFEVAGEVKENLVYVRLTGEYAIWLGELVKVHNTDEEGAVLLLMEARDGTWQICDFQTDTP
ncbi:MAG: hypothetical protein K8I82_28120, partial [Anaerolineae bacterium]|nr:hypothetical protein [Anaerolineae bacterium]